MKKNLLLGIASTICAAALYVIGSTNQNTADSILVIGCICSCTLMIIVIFIAGIIGSVSLSKAGNFLFSVVIISIAAVIQYVVLYNTTADWPLYYSVPTAFVSGLLFIWIMNYIREGLHSLSE